MRKCVSLGGLFECKYQIRRLGLATYPSFFDTVLTPTKVLANLISQNLRDALNPDRVVIHQRWDDTTYKATDPLYGVSSIHDFEIRRSLGENVAEMRSKYRYLTAKWLWTMADPAYTVFFHRATLDGEYAMPTNGDFSSIFLAMKAARCGNPFHLVFVTIDGVTRGHYGNVSFYKRPVEEKYNYRGDNLFWETMVDDLVSRSKA